MSRRDPLGVGYDPTVLRTLLEAYGRILREFTAMRRDSNDVGELLAIAACVDEIEAKRDSCQRRLDRIECQRHNEARRAALWQERQGVAESPGTPFEPTEPLGSGGADGVLGTQAAPGLTP